MTDLRVVAQISAKPGTEDVVRDALAELVRATRAEDGCQDYQLFESQNSPGVFLTIESWRGQEDMDAHMSAPHVSSAFATAGEHISDVAIHQLTPVDV